MSGIDGAMVTSGQLLKMIVSLGGRRPAPGQPAALDALFRELAAKRPQRPPQEVENEIWATWASHPDRAAGQRLALATRAIASEELARARRLIEPLVDEYPQWSEAWNKRATLADLEARDTECFADIRRTLELEPRHFGAVCGFAQACLRRGERATALTAFEVALTINPHLTGVWPAVHDLRESLSVSIH
jgi:tetratricopeptide (TPR) repeat protein